MFIGYLCSGGCCFPIWECLHAARHLRFHNFHVRLRAKCRSYFHVARLSAGTSDRNVLSSNLTEWTEACGDKEVMRPPSGCIPGFWCCSGFNHHVTFSYPIVWFRSVYLYFAFQSLCSLYLHQCVPSLMPADDTKSLSKSHCKEKTDACCIKSRRGQKDETRCAK